MVVKGQVYSANNFSLYSMYGVGELQSQEHCRPDRWVVQGLLCVCLQRSTYLNPAAYSTVLRRSALFDFGLEGSSYFASQETPQASERSTVDIQLFMI